MKKSTDLSELITRPGVEVADYIELVSTTQFIEDVKSLMRKNFPNSEIDTLIEKLEKLKVETND